MLNPLQTLKPGARNLLQALLVGIPILGRETLTSLEGTPTQHLTETHWRNRNPLRNP